MSEIITIESFFIEEYNRLRNENNDLRDTIAEYEQQLNASTDDGGFTDLGKKVAAVKYEVNSPYSVFSYDLKNLTVEQLEKIAEKDDEQLWEWASSTSIGSYYGKVAKRETHTYPFSVRFKTYKEDRIYAYDPDKSRTDLIEVAETADTGQWVDIKLDLQCKELALDEIRELVSERIEKLKASE